MNDSCVFIAGFPVASRRAPKEHVRAADQIVVLTRRGLGGIDDQATGKAAVEYLGEGAPDVGVDRHRTERIGVKLVANPGAAVGVEQLVGDKNTALPTLVGDNGAGTSIVGSIRSAQSERCCRSHRG